MPSTKTILALSLAALTVWTQAQQTFHADNARSGIFHSPSLRELNGIKWKFKTEAPIVGSPALSNGVFFIGSLDGYLYAVNQDTGLLKWKFETKGGIASTPAVSNGLVYFGSWDGYFYALEESTGKFKWKFAMRYERKFQAKHLHGQEPAEQTIPDVWDFFLSSPAISNGLAVFGSGDGNIYALDASNGALKWRVATGEVVHSSPAIANNTVYIGGFDSRLYALNLANGKQKWVFQAGVDPVNHNQQGFQASPCVSGDTVYLGCRDAHIYAIDANTGKKRWGFSTKTAWVSNSPAVSGDLVFAGARTFYGLDIKTGTLRYDVQELAGLFSSVALTSDTAYFGSLRGRMVAFDIKTGKVLWEFQTDAARADPLKVLDAQGKWDPAAFSGTYNTFEDDYVVMYKRYSVGAIMSSPIVDRGEVYFGSTDGNFYALH